MATRGNKDGSEDRFNPANVHTIINKQARFDGKLTFEGTVRIDGNFEGEVFTDDFLVIGPNAVVRATLNVGVVEICGRVEGEIIAKSMVTLKHPAQIKANVVTPAITIEEGVIFDGSCQMSQMSGRAPESPTD